MFKKFLNRIKKVITYAFWVIVFILGLSFYMTSTVEGNLGYLKQDTLVSSNRSLEDTIDSVSAGTIVESISSWNENSVRIRYYNDEGVESYGYIKQSNFVLYKFPDIYSSAEPVVITVPDGLEFDDFLDEFTYSLQSEQYAISGVYIELPSNFDVLVYDSNQQLITDFCQNLNIPYGYISAFNDNALTFFSDNEVLRVVDESPLLSFNILPWVWTINDDVILRRFNNYEAADLSSTLIKISHNIKTQNITCKGIWLSYSMALQVDEYENVLLQEKQSDTNVVLGYSSLSVEYLAELNENYSNTE